VTALPPLECEPQILRISWAEYRALPHRNWSSLTVFDGSPMTAIRGQLVHALVLEPETVARDFLRLDVSEDDALAAASPGGPAIVPDRVWQDAERMADTAWDVLSQYDVIDRELSFVAEAWGHAAKGRADAIIRAGGETWLCDLKSRAGWWRGDVPLRDEWWGQLGWYHHGLAQAGMRCDRIVVLAAGPRRAQLVELDVATCYEHAEAAWRRAEVLTPAVVWR